VSVQPLRHEALDALGLEHGFGVRNAPARADVARPVQVHGVAVARVDAAGTVVPEQADAIVTSRPRQCVGVITADCVPILVASESGRAVAAIHAGWRGLAAGVIECGLEALAERAKGEAWTAVIGPHIRACCYEVDEPVRSALAQRFGESLVSQALEATRPEHGRIDLAQLARYEVERLNSEAGRCLEVAGCTRCDADRFHSYRRDGAQAGRLLHFIAPS